MNHRSILASTAGLLALLLAASPSPGANTGFVTVSGDQFRLNGQPYYFTGANFWQGMNLAAGDAVHTQETNRARLGRELDRLQALGVTNLRVMASSEGPDTELYRMVPSLQTSPGVYNASVFGGLDYLLNEMDKRNMRAVMVLNNMWHWSGGMAQYVQWSQGGTIPYPGDWTAFQNYASNFYTNSQCQTRYQNYISTVANRVNTVNGKTYKNDPAIFSWELANEPRTGNKTPTQLTTWVNNTAAYIKGLDSNHMVTTGSEGAPYGPETFVGTHNGPNIDYATCHIWPQNWGWYNPQNAAATFDNAKTQSLNYLRTREQAAASTLNKPLVLEEFGLARDYAAPQWDIYNPASSTNYRNQFYEAMFDEVYAKASTGGALAGDNFWAWGGEGRPGDLAPQWIGDPPHEMPGWYSVYDTDASTKAVISGHAADMNALVPEPDTLTLLGMAGSIFLGYGWRRRKRSP